MIHHLIKKCEKNKSINEDLLMTTMICRFSICEIQKFK